MRKHCYFLVFRRYLKCRRKIDWDNPTGGLVMNPVRMVEGIPVADMRLAGDILAERYHCGPHEELVIAEVLCRKEKRLARELHRKWDAEMSEFVEMMSSS